MKRLLALMLAAAIMTPVVSAKPWYKDAKVWTVIGLSVGSSITATYEIHKCREKFGPAPCNGGYGEFKAREIARGATSVGLTAISLWGRHEGFKEWSIFSVGFSTYNTITAIRQARVGCPIGQEFVYGTRSTCQPSDEWTNVDLSNVQLKQ